MIENLLIAALAVFIVIGGIAVVLGGRRRR